MNEYKINTDTTGITIDSRNIPTSTGKVVINNVEVTDIDSWNKAISTFSELENKINNLQSKIDKAYDYLDKFIPNERGVLLAERQWNYVKSILKEDKDETNNN